MSLYQRVPIAEAYSPPRLSEIQNVCRFFFSFPMPSRWEPVGERCSCNHETLSMMLSILYEYDCNVKSVLSHPNMAMT